MNTQRRNNMSMERLKQFTYNTLVPQGFNMVFKEPTVAELEQLIEITNSVKEELESINNGLISTSFDNNYLRFLLTELTRLIESEKDWRDKYDECWNIKDSMFAFTSFDWCDAIGSYEEDIMAFYHAAKKHIEGL